MVVFLKKRGQTTVFIILGILILLIAGTAIYLSVQTREIDFEEELIINTPEAQVKAYIDSCLKPITLNGLDIMRKQGGYINVNQAQDIFKVDATEIPFWLTKEETIIPSLTFMEQELSTYILGNIKPCLGDFQAFKDQNFDITTEDLSVKTAMGNSVVITLDCPIKLSNTQSTTEVTRFVFEVPINMELIHNIASDLTIMEATHAYLEHHTTGVISLYSEVDETFLPPRTATRINLDCSSVTWAVENSKDLLKKILSNTISDVNIAGTNFKITQAENKEYQEIYSSMIYDIFVQEFPDIKVDFIFKEEWDFEFDINPNKGGLIKPQDIKQTKIPFVPMLCIFEYESYYDVEYPVIVKITDAKSAKIQDNTYFESEGFTFQFPLYVFINANQEREEAEYIPFELDAQTITDIAESLDIDDYIIVPGICDEKTSEEITLEIKDSITQNPIEGVIVEYQCANTECDIGITDENGILKSKFPQCEYEENLILNKVGYDEFTKEFSGISTYQSYELSPPKDFTVFVKKVNLPTYMMNYGNTGSLSSVSSPLVADDIAIISLTGTKDTSVAYPLNEKISLVPGSFVLSILLQSNISIPESPFYGPDGSILGTLPGIDSLYPTGSIEIPITITNEDIAKNFVTFYVFSEYNANDLNTWDDLSNTIIQEDNSLVYDNLGTIITITKEQYAAYMQPEFS